MLASWPRDCCASTPAVAVDPAGGLGPGPIGKRPSNKAQQRRCRGQHGGAAGSDSEAGELGRTERGMGAALLDSRGPSP